MGTKLTDFLKTEKETETAPVQGYVPAELRKAVIEQMAEDKKNGEKIGWNQLLEAGLRTYLAERKAKSVSKTKAN